MDKIIGREVEKKIITDCLKSDKSKFLVVYGRRRIGNNVKLYIMVKLI